MDETAVIQKLSRRIRALNFMLGTFFVLMLAMIAILAILTIKVVGFIHDTTGKINTIQQTVSNNLNFKDKICNNKSVSNYIGSSICE